MTNYYDPLTYPTAEAYEAATQAYIALLAGEGVPTSWSVPTIVDAVWPLAVAEGRRQVFEEIALFTIDDPIAREHILRYLADALTREDTEG